MNSQEAAQVLGMLTAAWPGKELPDATIALWAEQMRDVSVESGMEAARLLTRVDRFFPSYARFRETAFAASRRYEASRPPALEAGQYTAEAREVGLRALAECRASLAAKGARNVRKADDPSGLPT